MVCPSFPFYLLSVLLVLTFFFLLTKKRERGNKGEGVEREKKDIGTLSRGAP